MKKLLTILLTISLTFVYMYIPIVNDEVLEVKAAAKTLREMKQELAKYEKEYQESLKQKELTNEEIKNINTKVSSINITITEIGDSIVKLNEEIEELNVSIVNKDEQIKKIANFMQLSSGDSVLLKYAFGAEDFTDFIYRMAVSEQLTNYNQTLITEYNNMITTNEKKKEELIEKEKDLETQKVLLAEELTALKLQVSKIYEHQVDIAESIKTQKSIISMYESIGCKDDDDINICSKTTKDVSFWRPLKSAWVTSYYGMRWHPTLGGYRLHEGVDLGGNGVGTAVYSVANGMVAAIRERYWCGGNIIWIIHNVNGQKFTSQYQHLYKINVKKGDYVTKNTIIGTVGGAAAYTPWDSCSTGAHLHFGLLKNWIGTDYAWADSKYYANLVDPRTYISMPSYFSTRN